MLIPAMTALLLASAPAPLADLREPIPLAPAVTAESAPRADLILEIVEIRSAVAAEAQEVVREPAVRTLVTIVVLAAVVGALLVLVL